MTGVAWATSEAAQHAIEAASAGLVGQQLTAVRYLELDLSWRREDALAAGSAQADGPRLVTDEEEWSFPPWRLQEFDLPDVGLELMTARGETFAAARVRSADRYGVALWSAALEPEAGAAVWDVTRRSRWAPVAGATVTAVERSWRSAGPGAEQCCAAVSLWFGGRGMHLTSGDASDDGQLVTGDASLVVLSDPAARRYGVGPYASPAGAPWRPATT